ncbi:RagB/SusD family nutrient uptake outer membrane protein [Chitinophaga cymbidii]|uniref:Glycan metabolism protein RagB n=1 Tax=Chitinophaga cymbidii TaxID=1096750 RepID=A0A512RQY0_9BACT|nr:RagB/SusD family nutrient uptake outer membrane protein [Chitinophaga cymbidii]GEP98076.1 hypothetical protein CCY01nite_43360 [Chitinophaga cymbidii]
MRKLLYILMLPVLASCSDKFLDPKPNSNILTPSRPEDFQRLLDNYEILGRSASLPDLAADDYFINSYSFWQSSRSAVERASYVWEQDVYGGEAEIEDWEGPYEAVFYVNNVIAELNRQEGPLTGDMRDIYGQALLHRAKAYYDLVSNFSAPFDPATQEQDLGVPLRLDPSIDYTVQRSSVKACYDQIFGDVHASLEYLYYNVPLAQRNRPTRLAAFSLLARIHLSRREYTQAHRYADSALRYYDVLIDYNTVSTTSNTPFTRTNDELIMYGTGVRYNNLARRNTSGSVFVDTVLIAMYDQNDLRLQVYYRREASGYHTHKTGYNGTGLYAFSGFAVDELYLIKAECLAREDKLSEAAGWLDRLLVKRYKTGTYTSLQFGNKAEALQKVLGERRKELVWRVLRWNDIKRLNKEGANITLRRKLDDQHFTLAPNSPRYIFNIPQNEINRSNITQNQR